MAPYTVFVAALSVHYVTYVITRSEFPPALRVRDWVFDRWPGGWQSYLVTCGFCTALYVAGIAVLLTDVVVDVSLPVLLWLACASVAGALVEVVDALRSITVRSRSQ